MHRVFATARFLGLGASVVGCDAHQNHQVPAEQSRQDEHKENEAERLLREYTEAACTAVSNAGEALTQDQLEDTVACFLETDPNKAAEAFANLVPPEDRTRSSATLGYACTTHRGLVCGTNYEIAAAYLSRLSKDEREDGRPVEIARLEDGVYDWHPYPKNPRIMIFTPDSRGTLCLSEEWYAVFLAETVTCGVPSEEGQDDCNCIEVATPAGDEAGGS